MSFNQNSFTQGELFPLVQGELFSNLPNTRKIKKGKCLQCHNEFSKSKSNNLYCSKKCVNNAYRERKFPKNIVIVKCLKCSEEFERKRSDHKYCSKICLNKHKYELNREEYLKYSKQWRESNKERVKQWRIDNKDRLAKWYEKNRDRQNERKRIAEKIRYNKKKDEIYAKRKHFIKTNPHAKIATACRKRVQAIFRRSGIKKSSKTIELLGCTAKEAKQHIESQFKDGMSWDNYGFYGWHIDHIKPCAAFDLTDPEEQKKCFHYTNLQPLWWQDNLSKGKKYNINDLELIPLSSESSAQP
jgi:hypothetical protein